MVGFAVENVEGTKGTPSSAVSIAIWRGCFWGCCFFLLFVLDDHFLPAGIVFDRSESASCKRFIRWPYTVERVGITSLFEIWISSLSSLSSDELLPSLVDSENSASSSDSGVVPLAFDFPFNLCHLFFLSISEVWALASMILAIWAYLSTRSWTWNGSKNKDIMWMWKGNLREGLLPEAIGVVSSLSLYQVISLASFKVPSALRASPPRLQISNEETMEIVPVNVPDPPVNVQWIKKWVSSPARRSRIVFDFLSWDEHRWFIWMYDNDWGDCGKSAWHARASSMSSIVVSSQTTVNHVNNYVWK